MKINIDDTKFLNTTTDIKHKDVVTIDSEGKWQESQRFKKEDGTPQNEFRVNLKLANGDVRNTTLNWTNVKLLVQGLGDDSVDWIGKEVRAWKTKSDRAKSGFTFIYVPLDWERDDTGEWIIPEGSQTKKDEVEVVEYEDDPLDEIPMEDNPFGDDKDKAKKRKK